VGSIDGAFVGLSDGLKVGESVGFFVGTLVGPIVGLIVTAVGLIVGKSERCTGRDRTWRESGIHRGRLHGRTLCITEYTIDIAIWFVCEWIIDSILSNSIPSATG